MSNIFFKKKGSYTTSKIAGILKCKLIGDKLLEINGINTLSLAKKDEITFFTNHKYIESLYKSKAGACILAECDIKYAPSGMNLLVADNPHFSYAQLVDIFYDENINYINSGISPKAFIHKSAILGDGCIVEDNAYIGAHTVIGFGAMIMAGAYIGHNVIIGKMAHIGPNSSLVHCIIGDNIIIHAGARIGQDGFGFAINHKQIKKVKQIGLVRIGNNVEIGANTCIDRGTIDDTVIEDGVKIDNLVQIGHNVHIGRNSIIAAQSGISGSTIIGKGVIIGGQVGFSGHLNIGDSAKIAAGSGVIRDVPANTSFGGYPAVPINQWHKQNIVLKNFIFEKNKTKI